MSAIGSASGPIPVLNHHLEWQSFESPEPNVDLIDVSLPSGLHTYLHPHIRASSSLCAVPRFHSLYFFDVPG